MCFIRISITKGGVETPGQDFKYFNTTCGALTSVKASLLEAGEGTQAIEKQKRELTGGRKRISEREGYRPGQWEGTTTNYIMICMKIL